MQQQLSVCKWCKGVSDIFCLQPYVTFAGQNNLTGTMNATSPGSLATFLAIIKLPPRTTADWTIMADAGSDSTLAVCSVRVKDFGYGVPCLNKSTPTSRPAGGGRQSGWLELYKLTNIGIVGYLFLYLPLISIDNIYQYTEY